jgi:hypothetical protein
MTMPDPAPPNAPETVTGILCFLPWGTGSKSASLQPMIVIDQDTVLRLHVPGDNPFEHASLRPWEGKRCVITGTLEAAKRRLIVQNIVAAPVDVGPADEPAGSAP